MIKSLVLGGERADVKLYGFDVMCDVDLRAEMTGETTFLVDAALGSIDSTSLYGVHFLLEDLERFAVVAFHNGILADVADCTLHMGTAESAPELKVYTVDGVGFGVIVDDDVDSESVWKRLAEKADALIAIVRSFDRDRQSRVEQLYRTFSLPVAVCHDGKLYTYGMEKAGLMSDETELS